jgi:hypothetical protein
LSSFRKAISSLLKDKYGPDFESVINERIKEKMKTADNSNPYCGKEFL